MTMTPRVEQAGFSPLKDNDGYMWRRRVWPTDDGSSPEEPAEEIAGAMTSQASSASTAPTSPAAEPAAVATA